jgi:hypothetical protein
LVYVCKEGKHVCGLSKISLLLGYINLIFLASSLRGK